MLFNVKANNTALKNMPVSLKPSEFTEYMIELETLSDLVALVKDFKTATITYSEKGVHTISLPQG